jgi:transcriptional regulator with XRE-family HTH domain
MMTGQEMQEHLQALNLTQAEAAQLLGVSNRTVTRWCGNAEEVSGPAEAALRAWRRLNERHLAWRPDSVSIVEDDTERIATHRQEAINLDDILRRVEERGGPKLPWTVNLAESEATLGKVHVSFYKLHNGGFSLSVYSRRDGEHPDVKRDWPLIEDAIFCIAREFEKHRWRTDALRAFANGVRANSHVFGHWEGRSLTAPERVERQRAIETEASKIDALADRTAAGEPTTYRDFNAIMSELTGLGYSPPPKALVSAIARAYTARRARIRILLVRSGTHDEPVTAVIESDETKVNSLIAGRRLRFLGARLRVIGENTRMSSFAGPRYVVLEIPVGANLPGAEQPGLYLVQDLAPERVLQSN